MRGRADQLLPSGGVLAYHQAHSAQAEVRRDQNPMQHCAPLGSDVRGAG